MTLLLDAGASLDPATLSADDPIQPSPEVLDLLSSRGLGPGVER